MPPIDLSILTWMQMAPYLNQRVSIRVDDELALEAELIEVLPLGPEPEEGSTMRRGFSLLFAGPMEPLLPQRIYAIENAEIGRLDLFLVPIGPAGGHMRYEAILN
jgi:hypothetical protein